MDSFAQLIFLVVNLILVGLTISVPLNSNDGEGNVTEMNSEIAAELSFKELESGESSGEIINQCCARESRFVTLWAGEIERTEIRVDVGYCRQTCKVSPVKSLKREQFDKYLKRYPDMDPIQIFLILQNQELGSTNENENPLSLDSLNGTTRIANLGSVKTSSSSCLGSKSKCEPIGMKREKFFSPYNGNWVELDIIESCNCISFPDTCQKISKHIKFHPGTPYEKIIDVGDCATSGSCNSIVGHGGLDCKPIRNKTISLEGSNGVQCVPIIEECECVGNCYRAKEFYSIKDYTKKFDEIQNHNDTTSLKADDAPGVLEDFIVKTIDIGKCQGICQGGSNGIGASKCLLWSPNNQTCLSTLYGGHGHCFPNKLTQHNFMDENGESKSLISVTSCGCQ